MSYILETYESHDPVDFTNLVEQDISTHSYTPISCSLSFDNIRKINVLAVLYSFTPEE